MHDQRFSKPFISVSLLDRHGNDMAAGIENNIPHDLSPCAGDHKGIREYACIVEKDFLCIGGLGKSPFLNFQDFSYIPMLKTSHLNKGVCSHSSNNIDVNFKPCSPLWPP